MEIVRLDKSAFSDCEMLGGKGANLLALIRLGMPVPGGTIITTDSYEAHAIRCGLHERIVRPILAQNWAKVERIAFEALTSCILDDDLSAELLGWYKGMNEPELAVRSSATGEDQADASFAGQYETFLNVQGEENLVSAIRKCWASLWNRRVLSYRSLRSMDQFSNRMAVIIQEMVPAEVAGVLFTVDPMLKEGAGQMRIEVARGIGEAVVSGAAAGEVFRVERSNLETVGREGSGQLLSLELVKDLCRMALRVEEHFGSPQDIEFAVSGGTIFLLQARPMTSLQVSLLDPLDSPGKPSFLDRMIKPFVDERYAVAPRPLDNLVFTRLVGGHIHTIKECGGLIRAEDHKAFDAQIWRQAYRLPPVRRLWRALSGDLFHQFRMLRTDWQKWWENGPRDAIVAVSEPLNLSTMEDHELFEHAERILSVWQGPLYTRLCAASGIRAEVWLKLLVTLAVGFRKRKEMMACLMTGLDNPTIDTNEALWQLSRLARRNNTVREAVRKAAPEQLDLTLEGLEFLEAFGSFIQNYGHREGACWYLTTPTWRQDPKQVWRLLATLVDTEQRTGNIEEVRARRAAVLALIERRARFLPGLWPVFRFLLLRLSALNAFRERSHFDLTRPLAALQEIASEWGRRLTERGILRKEVDVGYLTYDEVRQWLTGSQPPVEEARELIARRRATYRVVNMRWQAERFYTIARGKHLRGVAASPGVVRGKVRIIRSERDFDRLGACEVLVSPYTNPAWTPLFATAVAVVTETGGVSSHAAIVAREYGIPAVMAVPGATRILKDDQEVLVDGNKGVVYPGKNG